MPFVRDKKIEKIFEELDNANGTIKTLSNALRDEEENNSILKKHRIILGLGCLISLIFLLWAFLPNSKEYKKEYLIKENLSLIDTDSLHKIQRKAKQVVVIDSVKSSLIDMRIVYSIQIGAYSNFNSNLISEDITQLEEFQENGFNKFSIGKFTSYKESVMLRDDLKRVGFKDCFIIAKSYGIPVNIVDGLKLSGEKWVRGASS